VSAPGRSGATIGTALSPSRARAATAATFVIHAVVFGSWTPHIPAVKERLGLHDGTLGLALLGAPIGSILAMTLVGTLVARWGSRRVMLATLIGYCVVAPGLGLAWSLPALFLALLLLGAFQGSLDIAMNAQAVAIESAYGRPIMSSFHAAWSLGAFAGAGIGTVAVGAGLGLAPQLALVGAVTALAAPLLGRPLLRNDQATGDDHRIVLPWGNRRLLLLGGIMFAALLCEGAAADWTAVYLRDSLAAPGQLAGLGYASFAVAMFAGRAVGDRWVARYGGAAVVGVLAAAAAVALGAVLVLGEPIPALLGFAVFGLGMAVIVPVCFSAAAAGGGHPGHAITAVATAGWLGFLIGPAVIGWLAHATSLPLALGLLPVLCAVIVLGARQLGVSAARQA
jgi:MFS family permease